MLSTDGQTDRQTNTTKNITSFAKEVKMAGKVYLKNFIYSIINCNLSQPGDLFVSIMPYSNHNLVAKIIHITVFFFKYSDC